MDPTLGDDRCRHRLMLADMTSPFSPWGCPWAQGLSGKIAPNWHFRRVRREIGRRAGCILRGLSVQTGFDLVVIALGSAVPLSPAGWPRRAGSEVGGETEPASPSHRASGQRRLLGRGSVAGVRQICGKQASRRDPGAGVGGGSLRRFIVNIALDACIVCTGRWRIYIRIAHPEERGDKK
jgi:hypothetical protein